MVRFVTTLSLLSLPVALPSVLSLPSQFFTGTGSSSGTGSPAYIDGTIKSTHQVIVKNIPSSIVRHDIPAIVIASDPIGLKLKFKSISTDLVASQQHSNSAPQSIESNSQDGEIILKHTVKKPIVQYIQEVITPTRKLTQQVKPVQEYVKTIVAKNYVYPSLPVPTNAYTTAAPPPPPAPTPEPEMLFPEPAAEPEAEPEPSLKSPQFADKDLDFMEANDLGFDYESY